MNDVMKQNPTDLPGPPGNLSHNRLLWSFLYSVRMVKVAF